MRLQIQHDKVPGRMRFRAPALYRSNLLKRRIQQSLEPLDAVRSVRINARTASVTLHFDPAIQPSAMARRADSALASILPDIGPEKYDSATVTGVRSASKRPDRPAGVTAASWHALELAEIVARLGADAEAGLTVGEALERLERYGFNRIGEHSRRGDLAILLEQFRSLPVAMLGVSAVVALLTGGRLDAAVILSVVLINAGIGFATERQAERTIASLDAMAPRNAEVSRDGEQTSVAVDRVVPGDLLLLSPGSQIAADARLLSARRLTVDESALTGESLPVSKRAKDGLNPDTPLSERVNMLHMGTVVTGGNARAVVVATGEGTELGQIQTLVETTRPPQTPLERQLQQLGTQLGILSGAVCAGIFVIGLVRGQPRLEMLSTSISLAVAAVPEGLPAVATTTLALGIREMNRREVAVRKIEAVETLGSLQVLCLDKTGTLTRNHMSVVAAYHPDSGLVTDDDILFGRTNAAPLPAAAWRELLQVVTLCSEAGLEADRCVGTPTEVALLELARANRIDIDSLRAGLPRLETRERAEGRPLMSTIHAGDSGLYIAVKGRPGEILDRSHWILLDGRASALDDSLRERILAANETMASRALRVLGVAYTRIGTDADRDAEKLTWVGLVGLQDPLRPGMTELMADFHAAGIKTVMITGDQSATAHAIAAELGLSGDRNLEILDSTRLDKIDPQLLSGLVRRVDVFSRVSPAHKLRIVQALQQSGAVVAMTGDGINDGPALKAADIGIAMGQAGTDIARSVADVVIKDDNLHTMREAVRQGRTIYADIRKTIHYMLATNFSEIEIMLAGIAGGFGALLNPMQLLWINLFTDIFPGLALSFEPADPDILRKPPRPAEAPIITPRRLAIMALESGFITAGSFATYLYGRRGGGHSHGSTLAFHSVTLSQLFHAYACRSEDRSIYSGGTRQRNPALEKALAGTALFQALAFSMPAVRRLTGCTALGPRDLIAVLGGAAAPMLVNELIKEIRNLRSATHANDMPENEDHGESEQG